MAIRKWSTGDYSEEARKVLGIAHRRARQRAGFKYRPAYAKAVGLSKGSIVNLETGVPVGEYVIEAVGHFLSGWTEDTPRQILEGGPAPEPVEPEVDSVEATTADYTTSAIRPAMFTDEWLDHYADILPEEDFLEVKLLMLAAERLQKRVTELERTLAERSIPQVNT